MIGTRRRHGEADAKRVSSLPRIAARRSSELAAVAVSHGERLRRAILLVVVCVTPLLVLPRYAFDPFHVPKLGFLIAGTSLAAGMRCIETLWGRSLRSTRLLAIPALLICVPLSVSWLFTPYKGWSLFGAFSRFEGLVPYIVFAVLGILLADAFSSRPFPLIVALAATGAVVGLYTFLQMVGLDPLPWSFAEPPSGSTVGNTNFSGAYMAITMPACVYLWGRRDGLARVGMAVTAMTALGLFLSGSQGAWAGAAGGVAVALALPAQRGTWTRRLAALVPAGVALLLVGLVVASLVFTRVPGVAPEAGRYRGLWWLAAADMSFDSPLVGHGPNAFALEGSRYRSLEDALSLGYWNIDDPHSVPLAFLANAGVLGLLGFAGAGVWVVQRMRRIRPGQTTAAVFAGSAIAYFVQSVVSIDEIVPRLGLWVALAGLAASTSRESGAGDRISSRRTAVRWVGSIAGVALVIAGVGFGWGLIRADHRVTRGIELFERGRVAEGRGELDAALSFRDESKYREVYFRHLGAAGLSRGVEGEPLIREMRAVGSYLESVPSASATFELARIFHHWGSFEPEGDVEALRLYRRGLALDPHHLYARIDLSEVLVDLGRPREAVEQLEPLAAAVGADRYPEFWAALSMAHLANGSDEAATVALRRGLALDPHDCGVLIARELLAGETVPGYSPSPADVLTLGFACEPGRTLLLLDRIPARIRGEYQ
jgi:hypothetical protein